jgi:hypothetical protein
MALRDGAPRLSIKTQQPTMSTTQNNTNVMDSCESEDEWVCNDEVSRLSTRSVDLFHIPITSKQLHLPNSPKSRQLQSVGKKRLAINCGLLPTVLVSPICPAAKRIKTEYNRRVTAIRCSIPDAYTKIRKLNYERKELTRGAEINHAEISRVQSELNKNHDIIFRAQSQMRIAHRQKKTKLEKIKTPAVFRYLTNNDKKAAKLAKFHTWSPLLQ